MLFVNLVELDICDIVVGKNMDVGYFYEAYICDLDYLEVVK